MSILRYFGSAADTFAEAGSAAFTSPAIRAASAVTPRELFRVMTFSQEEITGIRNKLIGYGPRAVVNADGKILGDLMVNKGMFVVDGAGRTRLLTEDDRITTAHLTTLSEKASQRFELNVEGDSWKKDITAQLSSTQAQAIRVTMPLSGNIELHYPDMPPDSKADMFKAARKVALVGFHAPSNNFPLPQGLNLHGVLQRWDKAFVGGTPLTVSGLIQVEAQPIDDCRLIEKPKTPKPRIVSSINDLFVALDC